MNTWDRRLMATGLALIAAGFVFGLGFSWSVDHQARLVALDSYQPVFEAIVRDGDDQQWRALEARISAESVAQRRAADVHGHAVNMGIVLVMLGLLAPVLGGIAPRTGDHRILFTLVLSAVVYPCGLFLQFLRLTTAGEIVSAIGALGVIGALAVFLLRVWGAVDRFAAS